MIFQAQWCDHCWKDRHAQSDPAKGCQIKTLSGMYEMDDPAYPKEWRHNPDTKDPECTAFLSIEQHIKNCKKRTSQCYKRREAQGQQRLFV